MIIFTIIGVITVYCYLHMLIFGGKIKVSLNNPICKIKQLFLK